MTFEEVRFGYPGSREILRGCTAAIGPGEVTAVAGPNGSGKSTLLRLAAGLLEPTAGRVLMDGRPVSRLGRLERAKRVAYVPQNPVLPEDWRVEDAAALGDYPHRESPPAPRPLAERLRFAREALRLEDVWERRAGTLSGGEAQCVALARALVQDTAALVLDEPASHLDLARQMALFGVLRDLADAGRAVLLATHDVTLSRRLGHRLLLLNGDGVLKPFPEAEAEQARVLEEAFGVPFTGREVEGVLCWFPQVGAHDIKPKEGRR